VNALLEQFLIEARESLQCIGEQLMQLEEEPLKNELMADLFRHVHTLKGNSGLFEFPELTRVLHAGEGLLIAVQNGQVGFSRQIADLLLDVMDFVGMLCDEIEQTGVVKGVHAGSSVRLEEALREISVVQTPPVQREEVTEAIPLIKSDPDLGEEPSLADLPELLRMEAFRASAEYGHLYLLTYRPEEECFFRGDDPFHQARRTPGLLWGKISTRRPWPGLAQLDPYCCLLDFHILSTAPAGELREHYRYVPDQIRLTPVSPRSLIIPQGDPNGGPVYDDFVDTVLERLHSGTIPGVIRSAQTMLELSNPELWISSALRWLLLVAEQEPDNHDNLEILITSLRTLTPPCWDAGKGKKSDSVPIKLPATLPEAECGRDEERDLIIAAQREILALPDDVAWITGRIRAVAASLQGCLTAGNVPATLTGLCDATESAVTGSSSAPLRSWLELYLDPRASQPSGSPREVRSDLEEPCPESVPSRPEEEVKFGRRNEESFGSKSIKVDQTRIDRLMSLIGEMVVAKNALPYLANRAESEFGSRELSREIKAQYAVINRIAEELQDSIMQVQMMPVSFVFQRFPRLVRDTSNRLGKRVSLILEGEETEADKNIIEALGDPLMHIVRNSLDHGIELPEQRLAAGKPASGTLGIRAFQEADSVVIEIHDDGKGIDPEVIKRKAREKGIISDEQLERLTDQEAVNLVFLPGFSTVEEVSDLSGRGVGMDVVRTAVQRVNGTIRLESQNGEGVRIRISLPLSMAITNVMIVESAGRIFGIPMETVKETVRVRRSAIKLIKKSMATVLRQQIVPLKELNSLLGLEAPHMSNAEDEFAVLVVGVGDDTVGILVDNFRETVDIVLKPMSGILAGITAYAGSALLGDGSVLMILNIREVVR
jgi:two-component system, chemotaxis family, sensor kinase CheA